jgi:hypothetical protein
MDINVNVKLSGDPELMMSLATLVQCIQDVLHVSNAQLATEKPAESSTAVPQPVVETVVQNPAPVVQQPVAPVAPTVAPDVPVAPPVPTAPAKNYTWAEIQTACAPLIDNGASQQALMALLPKYGVQSLMNIPQTRYGELVIDLRALGAKL